MRAGLHLAYGCASGNCGSCKARVVSGEVRQIREHDYPLSGREREMGYILTCSNTAVTDLVLEAAEALSVDDLPRQEIRATLRARERLGEDLMSLHLQTPRTQTLRFMAGQRALLRLEQPDGCPLAPQHAARRLADFGQHFGQFERSGEPARDLEDLQQCFRT